MDEARRQVFVVFAGLFGLVVGSFLNVVIFRLPRQCMSIAGGRSKCPGCRRGIAWYDNVPVLSWVLLRGKCRACGMRISPRYALIEALTGALFAWSAYAHLYHPHPRMEHVDLVVSFVLQCYLIAAIIASAFIDLDFEILPDEINWPGLVFGLVAGAAFPHVLFVDEARLSWFTWVPAALRPHVEGLSLSAFGAFVGAGSIYAVGVFGTLLFRRRIRELKMDTAMGLGDVKYLGFLGAFLGWKGILLTFLVSIFAGAVWGILKFAVRRGFGKVPFGPFLSLGALAVLFAREKIVAAVVAYMDFVGGMGGSPE